MQIGIIGAGQIGGTLTRLLTKQGHTVKVSNSRDPETLADLAAETGATAVWAKDAPVDADLVIVSIPQKNTPDLAPGIVSTRKPDAPVIETNNYYPQQRDGRIDAIEEGTPESVWVSEQLGAPVFKVFNGIFWKRLLENGVPRWHRRAGSRCRSPATTRRTSRSSPTWSTRSASTRSTPAPWPNPGASSLTPRSTAPTSTPRAPRRPWPKPRPSDPRASALAA